MKKFRNAAIVLMTAVMLFAGAGCGGGESVPEGFKRVQFRYSGDEYSSPRYIELVNTYNATQGQEDKVYVSPLPAQTILTILRLRCRAGSISRRSC